MKGMVAEDRSNPYMRWLCLFGSIRRPDTQTTGPLNHCRQSGLVEVEIRVQVTMFGRLLALDLGTSLKSEEGEVSSLL